MKFNWFNWLSLAHFIHHFVNYQNFVSILSLDHSTHNFSIVWCGVLVGGFCVVVVNFFFSWESQPQAFAVQLPQHTLGENFPPTPMSVLGLSRTTPLESFGQTTPKCIRELVIRLPKSTSAKSWELFDQDLGVVFLRP